MTGIPLPNLRTVSNGQLAPVLPRDKPWNVPLYLCVWYMQLPHIALHCSYTYIKKKTHTYTCNIAKWGTCGSINNSWLDDQSLPRDIHERNDDETGRDGAKLVSWSRGKKSERKLYELRTTIHSLFVAFIAAMIGLWAEPKGCPYCLVRQLYDQPLLCVLWVFFFRKKNSLILFFNSI